MDKSIFLPTIRYKFVIIICLRIFASVKRGDRTLMGCSRPNFSPKLAAYTCTNVHTLKEVLRHSSPSVIWV